MIYDIRHRHHLQLREPGQLRPLHRCASSPARATARGAVRTRRRSGRARPTARRRDFFGTETESVLIETAHRNLRIDSRSRVVSLAHGTRRATPPSPPWESVRDAAFDATSLGAAAPVGYVFA